MTPEELRDKIRDECKPMLPMLSAMAAANIKNGTIFLPDELAASCFNTYRALHQIALDEVMKPIVQPDQPKTAATTKPRSPAKAFNVFREPEFHQASINQGPPKDD